MTLIYIFALSGLLLGVLIAAKGWSLRKKNQVFLLRAITKGDAYVRNLYNQALHLYSEGREGAQFFMSKQLPLRSKNLLNKSVTFLKERRDEYLGNMRDSRNIKKSEDISDFIKNMAEVEKGNGEINEELDTNEEKRS